MTTFMQNMSRFFKEDLFLSLNFVVTSENYFASVECIH